MELHIYMLFGVALRPVILYMLPVIGAKTVKNIPLCGGSYNVSCRVRLAMCSLQRRTGTMQSRDDRMTDFSTKATATAFYSLIVLET